jgi:Tol biopolymer transport system component
MGEGGYLGVGVERVPFAVSPDGSRVAYIGGIGEGPQSVWIRLLSGETATMLSGTVGADSVFWSPDSRSIGFFAAGRLMRLDLQGGGPVKVCDVQQGIGQTGTWGDGQILFASVQGDQILRVAVSGGMAEEVLRPNLAAGENRVSWPSFLPDGRRFLYLSVRGADKGVVMLASPDGTKREVLPVRSNAQYVQPGYLLYGQDGVLLARRMDPDSGQVSGEPASMAEGVSQFPATAVIQFSASPSGTLAYHAGVDVGRITNVDRTGRERAEIRPAGAYHALRLSRDGGTLYLDRNDARSRMDIWKFELDRGVESRVTTEPAAALDPVFTPDGSMIFSALRGSSPMIVRRSPSGSDELMAPSLQRLQTEPDLTADGRWMMYSQRVKRGNSDLLAVSMDDRRIVPFHQSDADEHGGRFSPDGRWVAFVSDAGGRFDIYIAPFPGPGPAHIVSVAPGTQPRWSLDGRQLFYVAEDGTIYSVPVTTAPSLKIGRPQALFSRGARGRWSSYEPTRDGGFIALEPISYGAQSPLHVIVNWPTLIAR